MSALGHLDRATGTDESVASAVGVVGATNERLDDGRDTVERLISTCRVMLRAVSTHYTLLHMPISIDQFDDGPDEALEIRDGTNQYEILRFLATNDEQAFTQSEIHEATDVPRGSVGVVLSRLEDRGLVRHRGRYWAVAADDRLASFAAQRGASSASTTDDYYGSE